MPLNWNFPAIFGPKNRKQVTRHAVHLKVFKTTTIASSRLRSLHGVADVIPRASWECAGPWLGSAATECSENPPRFRQRRSRIFTAFRNVASVFVNYWVLEHQASYYIGVEGGLDDQNPGQEGF
jgi:hypothetical protein